jgi:hypothetical protein
MYLGTWGIMRVRGERASLLPLPDNPVVDRIKGDTVPKQATGQRPFQANYPGQPCPSGPGVPRRNYDVVAMQADLEYNKDGDHDPFGLIYAVSKPGETPEQTVARVRAQGEYEPLVLRANEGDCLQVKLTNEWLSGHGNTSAT